MKLRGVRMKDSFIKLMKASDLDEFNLIRDSEYGEKLSYINILHLYIISHTEKITASQLADKLKMSRPAITQKVNDLEKLGMVNRTQSAEDKRVFYISISDELKELLKESKMATVLDAVDENFPEEKKAVFAEVMDFMTNYVNGVGANE